MMHRILARQLRRLGLDADAPPPNTETWQALLTKVGDYYEDADQSRYLLERSMHISSQEMHDLNQKIKRLYSERVSRSDEHYRRLFDQTPIPTWEEDFTKVAEWLEMFRNSDVVDLESYLDENPGDLDKAISLIEIVDVNPAAIELVRATDEAQLLGPLHHDLITEESRPSWIAQLKAIWDEVGEVKFQLLGTRLDGEKFHGILHWHVPVIEGEFDYSRVLVTIVDITEQTEAERQIRQVLKSKDEFLASISHELRTPLTSVLGFAQVLRTMDEEGDEKERDSLLGIIADQAADLSDIVEDLLVAARSELGQLTVASVPIDIHAQIAQVHESRSNNDQRFVLPERPAEKSIARGDPQRIRQILRNLLTNADRYGGSNVRIKVITGSDFVKVQVQDNGMGLSEEASDKLFERYYRTHEDQGQPGSVGIGLTISRELARMMGGDLVYRRDGDWTSFELTLPRDR